MVRFASFLVVFGALFTVVPAVSEDRMIMASGDPFPELSLPAFTSTADRSYLGLVGETDLTPSQIKANLLLVELLNVHCSHCQKQTPSYSELFRLI